MRVLVVGVAFFGWCAVPTTAQLPVGDEFPINSYTTNGQSDAVISHDPSGGFVIAWQGSGQDGNGDGIFGQRFGADGLPVAGEFPINSFTTGNQHFATISHDPSGGFVVAWEDGSLTEGFGDGQDGSGDGVFGQRYSSDGLPMAGEFQINSSTTGDQRLPVISHDPSGGFVVAWDNGGSGGIFGRRFGSDGQPEGGEFQVNSVAGIQFTPAISHDLSGGFVVVWTSLSNISGRRFGSDGLPVAGEFQINSDTSGFKGTPAISHSPSEGGFVVAWTELSGQDGSSAGIFGQRFGSDGLPVAGEFPVNSFTTANQSVPTISHDPSGAFVVVWEDEGGQDGSGSGIFGQRFGSDGLPVAGEFQINSFITSNQRSAAISHDPSGDFVVAWQGYGQDGSQYGVFGQRFAPPPVLSIAPACAARAEGDAGIASLTFTVTRTGNTSGTASVDYEVTGSGGNPADTADFGGSFPSGTVDFVATATSETITVAISGDIMVEMDEGFTVTLGSPVDATISTGTADGTIQDDDGVISLRVITEIIDATGDGGKALDGTVASAVDDSGNVYVTGLDSDNVFKIAPGGAITEIIDATGDGANALSGVREVAVSGSGNVYVTGFDSNNAFQIAPGGAITEIIDATGDGAGATLSGSIGVAVDGSDNVYVVGNTSSNVFQIAPGGAITEILDVIGDGAGNLLLGARGVAVDGSGNVYVTGFESNNAFQIAPGGAITEIIDSTGDGAGNPLSGSIGVAADSSGNVYVTGLGSDNAFRIDADGVITEIIDASGDGAGATLSGARAVAVAGPCNVYVTGFESNNAFEIALGGAITEIVDATGDGTGGSLSETVGVAVDGSGKVYVAGFATDNAFEVDRSQLSIAPTSADQAENDAGDTAFTFTLTRTGNTSSAVSASYAVTGTGDHPADAADFGGLLPSGSVDFAADDTLEVLTVLVSGDTAEEMDEGFTVTLGLAGDPALGTARAEGTIRNDDASLSIVSTDADKVEGDAGTTSSTFTVIRTGDTSGTASATYVVTGAGGAPADVTDFGGALPSGSVDFAGTETQQIITIDVSGDSTAEPDEGFTVTLQSPVDASIGAASADGTIRNDDGLLTIEATDADRAEGDDGTTTFTFTVSRDGDASGLAAADYQVTGGGAEPADGVDFGGAFPSGTVTLVAADTAETILVEVSGDTDFEADESFTVTLSNASGSTTIGTAVAGGTIRNDDAAIEAEEEAQVLETCGYRLTFVRVGDLNGEASVTYQVEALGPNPASPEDFVDDVFPFGTVTFADQESQQTLDLLVTDDDLSEGDENFQVTLSNPIGATLATLTVDGLIVDDDGPDAIFFACFETGDTLEWD